ncbi:MAG: glutamine synthetase family protein [Geminicoccaceae bacterium]
MIELEAWLRERRITEVECLVADMSGIPRGKILPAGRFVRSLPEASLRLPEDVFIQTVTGNYPDLDDSLIDPGMRDIRLRPDSTTIRTVPWYPEPTAQVICDAEHHDGEPVVIAPREVLKRVLRHYADKGWQPVVAPEVEFFLTKVNEDPDYPLQPPIGRNRRPETSRQAYGIDAANEFDPLFEDVFDWCEAAAIDVDTLIHEGGAGQLEFNFNHGDPLELADQVFLFKRIVREAALKHGIYATFMAKPIEEEAGSAMHLHQSVYALDSGLNLFGQDDDSDSDLFRWHIGGLQRYLPHAMPLLAPNVNSYRRLIRFWDAPINLHWGYENRTAGLRVPQTARASRRVENRVAGADVNPYLAIAASLACGYLGMIEQIEPDTPIKGSAYRLPQTLPRYMPDGLRLLRDCPPLHDLFGSSFVRVLLAVKSLEHDEYQSVISSWEREHLLLNV